MNIGFYYFKDVTLLITHYNRSSSLERLLQTFIELNCSFDDIVVSDDGSNANHLNVIKKLMLKYSFRLITAPANKGLGNNINKGQDAVNTMFTLYVQEDFIPLPEFPNKLACSLIKMNQDKSIDIVRFYSYIRYPYLKPIGDNFSEMLIKTWYTNYKKIYCYSDHPHLRYSNFFSKFGRYAEGLKGDRMEYLMCLSFIQNKGKGLFYEEYKNLFSQENSSVEPSTMNRSSWTHNKNPFIKTTRDIYRQLKYNFDINFTKVKL